MSEPAPTAETRAQGFVDLDAPSEAPAPLPPITTPARAARVIPAEALAANRAAGLDLGDGEDVVDLLVALASARAPCAFLACGVPDEGRWYLVARHVLAGGGSVVALADEAPSATLAASLRAYGSQVDVEDAADLFARRSRESAKGSLTRWGPVAWLRARSLADALAWDAALRRPPTCSAGLFSAGVGIVFAPGAAAATLHRALRSVLGERGAYVFRGVDARCWLDLQAVSRDMTGGPVPEAWQDADGSTFAIVERRPSP